MSAVAEKVATARRVLLRSEVMSSVPLDIMAADFVPSANQPIPHTAGSAVLVEGYTFAEAEIQALQLKLRVPDDYVSGGTISIPWYADTATADDIKLGGAVCALSPGDNTNTETITFSTEVTVIDTHDGTTAKRLHSVDIVLSPMGSPVAVAGDTLWIQIRRHGGDAADTLSGAIVIMDPTLAYTS